jgi:hypothetical protein
MRHVSVSWSTYTAVWCCIVLCSNELLYTKYMYTCILTHELLLLYTNYMYTNPNTLLHSVLYSNLLLYSAV